MDTQNPYNQEINLGLDEMIEPMEDATVGQRFVNYLIDSIIIGFAGSFLNGLLLTSLLVDASRNNKLVILYLSNLAISIIYYGALEGITHGRTIGKLITRTYAVDYNYQPVSLKDALLRSVCRMIPFNPLSAFGGHPWHDSLTNTRVVKKEKNPLR